MSRMAGGCSTLLIAGALALGLMACGGGDDPVEQGDSTGPGLSGSATDSGSAASGSEGEGSVEATDPPTPGFEDASGQTAIPAFGVEADEAERAAVEGVLKAYLQAGGAGEWSRACENLAASASAELGGLAGSSGQSTDGRCAATLPRVVDLLSRYQDPYFGPVSVSGLRVKESAGAGFALFHGDDGHDYWVSVRKDGDRWGVLSTLPTPLDR